VGYNKDEIDTWIPSILAAKPDALTIHARTRKEMSLVPARWEDVKRVVELAKGTDTVVIGNGDISDLEEGRQRAAQSGAAGVMIGRGIFGNPWLFDASLNKNDVALEQQLRVMLEHTELFEKYLGEHKNFAIMRKHYSAYVRGFNGARELRTKLMETKNASEVRAIVEQFLAVGV
jgi:tRNA-dihydrouridine synthase